MADRTIRVEVIGDSKKLERAFSNAGKSAEGFAARTGRALRNVAKAVAVASAAIAAGTIALGARAVSSASDLNEQINKSTVVFGKSSAAIQKWSQTTATALGLSQTAALEAAGGFGLMLQTAGLTEGVAAKFSKRLVELAADMASFNNIDPSEALLKLKSGLAGEAEPLRTVGVLLSEARVKQEAYATGIAKAGAELTEGQKVQARYNLILKDTAKQQGDFARTSDSLANAQRIVRASMENISAQLGSKLLPIVAKATSSFAGFLTKLSEAKTIDAKFAVVGDAFEAFGRDVFNGIRDAINQIDFEVLFSTLGNKAKSALEGVAKQLESVDWRQVGEFVGERLVQSFQGVAAFIRTVNWGAVGSAIVAGISDFLKGVDWVGLFKAIVRLWIAALKAQANLLLGIGKELGSQIVDGLGSALSAAGDYIKKVALQLVVKALSAFDFLGRFNPFKGLKEKAQLELKQMAADARAAALNIQGSIDGIHGKEVVVKVTTKFATATRPQGPDIPPGTGTGAGAVSAKSAAAAKVAATVVKTTAESTAKAEKAAAATAAKARKAAAAAAEKAAAAAQAAAEKVRAAFDLLMDSLDLRLDKAGVTARFSDDFVALKAMENAVKAQIKEEGKTLDLQRKLFEIRQQRADLLRQQRNAKQFEALGLTAEGEKRVASIGAIRNRASNLIDQLKASGLDPAKIRAAVRRISVVFTKQFDGAGRDIRSAILTMFGEIAGALNDGAGKLKGPLTKTSGLNTKKLVAGLGLTPEQVRELRRRHSGFNTAGLAIAGGAQPPGGGSAGGEGRIVVENHLTVELDGQRIHAFVSKENQKASRRNPKQKRGPNRNR